MRGFHIWGPRVVLPEGLGLSLRCPWASWLFLCFPWGLFLLLSLSQAHWFFSLSLGVSWKSLLYFEFVNFTMSPHPLSFPIPPLPPKWVSLIRSFHLFAVFSQIYWLFIICVFLISHIFSLHSKWMQPHGPPSAVGWRYLARPLPHQFAFLRCCVCFLMLLLSFQLTP